MTLCTALITAGRDFQLPEVSPTSEMTPNLFLLQHPRPVHPGPHVGRQHHLLVQSAVLGTLLGHPLVQLLDAAMETQRVRAGPGAPPGTPTASILEPKPLRSLVLDLLGLWVL